MSLNEGLVSTLKCDHGKTHGIVYMNQINEGVLFQVFIKGLPPGKKGFHVHKRGNITEHCKTLDSHYNPDGFQHGGLNEPYSHRGDLGNLEINQYGELETSFISHKLTLIELLGRSLVIHNQEDDLGRGNDYESKTTGNSGSRLCCGVIGYA